MIYYILYLSNYYKVNSKSFNQKSAHNYIEYEYISIKYDLSIINWDYPLESDNDSLDMLSIFIEKLNVYVTIILLLSSLENIDIISI